MALLQTRIFSARDAAAAPTTGFKALRLRVCGAASLGGQFLQALADELADWDPLP